MSSSSSSYQYYPSAVSSSEFLRQLLPCVHSAHHTHRQTLVDAGNTQWIEPDTDNLNHTLNSMPKPTEKWESVQSSPQLGLTKPDIELWGVCFKGHYMGPHIMVQIVAWAPLPNSQILRAVMWPTTTSRLSCEEGGATKGCW